MPTPREEFTVAHNSLADIARRFQLWYSQYVPDLIFYHLLLDILEQGRAVATLIDTGVGRPAYVNSRAAFESTIDILALVAVPSEYCLMGARARAWEVVDTARMADRLQRADDTMRIRRNDSPKAEPAETIIQADAAFWDVHAPAKGDLLREAFVQSQQARPGKHWSGLSKAALGKRIAALSADGTGVTEMIDAMYGLQSIHSHPGARVGLRQTITNQDGTLTIAPRPIDQEGPLMFATMAATLGKLAAARRPAPVAGAA